MEAMMRLLFLFTACFISSQIGADTFFEQSQKTYLEGLAATEYQQRQEAFNRTLFLLQESERKDGNVLLFERYAALGDVYFQLNALPWAVLYYERALRVPKNYSQEVASRLNLVQQKLMLPESSKLALAPDRFMARLAQEKEWIFASLILALFSWLMLYPAFIFKHIRILSKLHLTAKTAVFGRFFDKFFDRVPQYALKICAVISSSLFFLLVFNALFFYLVSPIEAILVRSTAFYRFPEVSGSLVYPAPLFAGLKVQILEMTEDKKWIKIKEGDSVGYIETKTCRLI